MKTLVVQCYMDEGNNAILRLPSRNFPGVLVQGDTLRNIVQTAKDVSRLSATGSKELRDEAEGLVEFLEEIQTWFELAVRRADGH